MDQPSQLNNIAICINDTLDYSACCMKESLQGMGYPVDIIALRLPIDSVHHIPVKLVTSPDELGPYDLLIYQYGDLFSELSDWFSHYEGILLMTYQAGIPLSCLRPYHHAAHRVRQLELKRQQLAEWMHIFAHRVYWLPESLLSARDLIGWGVKNIPENIAVLPPFIQLDHGAYESRRESPENLHIFVAGDFTPDKGHKMMLNILYAYLHNISEQVTLYFAGPYDTGLCVYQEEVIAYMQKLGLESHVHLEKQDFRTDLDAYLQADVMLFMEDFERFCPQLIQAQAMGLPIVRVMCNSCDSHSIDLSLCSPDDYLPTAKLLHKTVYDGSARSSVILEGYRNIAEHYTHERVEQAFLTHVLTAILR